MDCINDGACQEGIKICDVFTVGHFYEIGFR